MTRSIRSLNAEKAFRARVAELGGGVLETEWLGSGRRHHVTCAKGHDCYPIPDNTAQRTGICRVCANNDPVTAEKKFRARVAALGGTLTYTEWLGNGRPHTVVCAAGHICTPRPSNVAKGFGFCRECAGQGPVAAEKKFRARLAELGATLVEPTWLGSGRHHRVICAEGHECSPIPDNVAQGHGFCLVCANMDPVTAEKAFRARLAELGATATYTEWLGNGRPHTVVCASGHICTPRPSNVQQGMGICRSCAVSGFNMSAPAVVYLITNAALCAHKLGITGGDRVERWQRRGWQVHATHRFELGADAHRVEQSTLQWLRDDLGLDQFLIATDGATETVDAAAIDLETIWQYVTDELERIAA